MGLFGRGLGEATQVGDVDPHQDDGVDPPQRRLERQGDAVEGGEGEEGDVDRLGAFQRHLVAGAAVG